MTPLMSLCSRLPWLVAQTEADMLFLSWPVPPESIAGRIPAGLSLETFDDRAWITLIPFQMERLRARWLPPLPLLSRFAEVDCLTYVRSRAGSGIWFFRIDADTLVGGVMGRLIGLPYHHSRLSLQADGDWREFRSEGKADGAAQRPELRLRYRPHGSERVALPGTLEHFIVERFAMYSRTRRGTLLQGRETRPPRLIQDCAVSLFRNTLPEAAGVPGPSDAPVAWYCTRSLVHTWLPAPVT
jgi:uncharacterized protein YqjF (DUF2071 family)